MRRLRLDWIDRDGKLLILAGCISSVVPAASGLGYSTSSLGDTWPYTFWVELILLAGGVGGLFAALLVVVFAEKIGRRRLLVLLALMAAVATLAYALTNNLLILLPFVFLGAVGRSRVGRALLQASLADTAPPDRRTDLYAIYHIAKRLTNLPVLLVVLLVSAPFIFFTLLLGFNEVYYGKTLAPVFVLLLLAAAFLYSRVSPAVEAPVEARKPVNPLKLPSRRVIFTLSGLFGLNSLALTMLYWSVQIHSSINWSEEGHLDRPSTNLIALFLAGVLAVPALWLAAKVANRFGLVKILALTQMAAPLFIIPVAFIPGVGLSVLFRTLYYVLRGMSVPLRDSYAMGVVAPAERIAMAGIIILGMNFPEIFGPLFGGYFLGTGQVATPLFAGAALAVVANTALYRMFRNVKPPEEMERLASDTP